MNGSFPVPSTPISPVHMAAARIAGVAHRTPVLTARRLDALVGADLFFKAEHLQRVGAFKFRGAVNAIAALDPAVRSRGVVAYSSGNHAQAIALAASLAAIPAVIVMPEDAPAMKVAATRGYGAEVVLYDRYTQDRNAIGTAIATTRGLTLLPPFDHLDIIAGQGTAALELFEEVGPLDMLLVPIGGGGLIAGSALAAAELSPDCEIVGVEPEAGNDAQQSLACRKIVTIPVPHTIADGAQTTAIGALTFAVIGEHVSRIVTVSDAQLIETMRVLASGMKQVVEPTGCLAAAAVLQGVVDVSGKRVGIILSGGNIDIACFAALIGEQAS